MPKMSKEFSVNLTGFKNLSGLIQQGNYLMHVPKMGKKTATLQIYSALLAISG